jgi:hypothetical protein
MSKLSQSTIEMIPGQSSVLLMSVGDRLHVLEGKLIVRPAPEWLGECMVACDVSYSVGGVHVAARRGYVSLCAVEPARAVRVTPAEEPPVRVSVFSRFLRSLGRMAAPLTLHSK